MRLVLVLGDQLSPNLSALRTANKATDVIIMAEALGEANYVRHHPKKIALIFAAMRKFAAQLRGEGWQVRYSKLDDEDAPQTLNEALLQGAEAVGATEVICTEAGEWRVIDALAELPLTVTTLSDDRFLSSHQEFESWAEGRKQLRMEYFYRDMRRKTGLLMEGDQPAGGQWNYDHDNRKAPPKSLDFEGPFRFEPDAVVREVLDLVAKRFGENFGTLEPFWFATDALQAQAHFDHWIATGLAGFGDYQDAMLLGQPHLYHAHIGMYLNIGLLDPLEVCQAVEKAWIEGFAPLNAVEGFIRQVIGWREYIRGIYFLQGRDYTTRNDLGHTRDLPASFWGQKTWMACIEAAVGQTQEEAYAHHIQRLMVTGNFALLAGVDPHQVHEWYLAVYADAFEWVEAPNVIGMSQFADGGIVASKPYVSSGNYIDKMSNYCKSCSYKVKQKTGPDACPFNLLYWHFLDRHSEKFRANPRMGNMYRVWDRMDEDRRAQVLLDADNWLAKLDAGEVV